MGGIHARICEVFSKMKIDRISSLQSFFQEIEKGSKGFVLKKDSELVFVKDQNQYFSYTLNQDELETIEDKFLDVDVDVDASSYPLDDKSDEIIFVLGELDNLPEEYNLLESSMKQIGINPKKDTLSSIVGITRPSEQKKDLFTYDFSRWITEKTKDFVGRQSLIESINRFIADNQRGYFVISAKPGMGKTALAAYLVQQNNYIHHFNIRSEGINKPQDFLRNICVQIISRYDMNDEYPQLPPEASQNSNFLLQLLNKISESKLKPNNKNLVIIVDALDEVDNTEQSVSVNTLYLPTTLPDNIYVIATMRQDSQTKLDVLCESENVTIDPYSKSNSSDILQYIHLKTDSSKKIQQFISLQKIDNDYFAHHMLEKSEGNFIYLHYVLSDIENGAYDSLGFNKIPKGLQQYYEQHWQIMRGKDTPSWFEYKIPVLVALTVTKRPISVDLISKFSKIPQLARVYDVLEEWKQFLYEEYVLTDDVQQKRYRLYHDDFHDFITRKDQVVSEKVDLTRAEKQIIDALMPEDESW